MEERVFTAPLVIGTVATGCEVAGMLKERELRVGAIAVGLIETYGDAALFVSPYAVLVGYPSEVDGHDESLTASGVQGVGLGEVTVDHPYMPRPNCCTASVEKSYHGIGTGSPLGESSYGEVEEVVVDITYGDEIVNSTILHACISIERRRYDGRRESVAIGVDEVAVGCYLCETVVLIIIVYERGASVLLCRCYTVAISQEQTVLSGMTYDITVGCGTVSARVGIAIDIIERELIGTTIGIIVDHRHRVEPCGVSLVSRGGDLCGDLR